MSWHTWMNDIQVLSMRSVVKGDESEYLLRHIFRWYSKEFSTPLHVVETLPLEDVIRAYWEVEYEGMAPEEREIEIHRLVEDEEKLRQRKREEDADDVDAYEFGKEAQADATKVPEKKPLRHAIPRIDAPPREPTFDEMRELPNPATLQPDPIKLKDLKELPSDMTITFIDDDSILDGSFGPPPKPKKG